MPIQNRSTLRKFFQKGTRPTEGNFSDLIDSMYNKLDDDILSPVAPDKTPDPSKGPSAAAPLDIMKLTKPENAGAGIGTVASLYKLHVNAVIASPARVGTYTCDDCKPETVLADGKWHKIITNLNGINAFEIVASVSGPPKSGNYALLHAIALCTYGDSKNAIVQHSARYKGMFENIELKWTGNTYKDPYSLEIRTRFNFGDGILIKYNITQLICE
jgi:hypothetical protein